MPPPPPRPKTPKESQAQMRMCVCMHALVQTSWSTAPVQDPNGVFAGIRLYKSGWACGGGRGDFEGEGLGERFGGEGRKKEREGRERSEGEEGCGGGRGRARGEGATGCTLLLLNGSFKQ